MPDLALLGVFAHPDDEQIMTGTFAKAAAEGIRTGLICATRGEAGEIHRDADATPETLGEVRERELRAACVVAGIKHLWFLDYRDSGWMGTPENDNQANLHNADRQEALEKIVRIIREFKPTIIVTFDETGGYGHYDHLVCYELATQAFSAAADPDTFPQAGEPWQAARLYYCGFPRSGTLRFAEMMRQAAPESSFAALDLEKMGLPDEQITNVVDAREWWPIKEQSLAQHRTQKRDQDFFKMMPKEIFDQIRGHEHFILAAGTPLPEGDLARGDIFAGLRET